MVDPEGRLKHALHFTVIVNFCFAYIIFVHDLKQSEVKQKTGIYQFEENALSSVKYYTGKCKGCFSRRAAKYEHNR